MVELQNFLNALRIHHQLIYDNIMVMHLAGF